MAYAGPTFVGVSTGVGAATAVSPDFTSSGRQAGDWLILAVESANEAIATPAGWTEVPTASPQFRGTAAAIGGVRLAVFTKVSDGTETTVSVADSGNHTFAAGLVVRPSNGYVQLAIDTSAGKNAAASTTHSGNAITTTAANCLVIDAIGTDRDAAAASYSSPVNASLTNLTEQFDNATTAGVGGGIGLFTGEKEAAGGVNALSVTSAANVAFCPITLAIKNTGTQYPLDLGGGFSLRAPGAYSTSAAAPTPSLPSGWAENDIFILEVTAAGGGVTTHPSVTGYTAFGTPSSYTILATTTYRFLYWKRATASESAPSIPDSGTTNEAQIFAYAGATTTGDPIDVVATAGQSTASTSIVAPDATTVTANALALIHQHLSNAAGAMSGWNNSVIEAYDDTGSPFKIGSKVQVSAGAIGSTTATSSASVRYNAATFALKPAATLTHYSISADTGAFTATGSAANTLAGRAVSAASGSFALAGTAAGLSTARKLTADTASFSLIGTAANLLKGFALGADGGSFVLAGSTADLRATRLLNAVGGAYSLTGTSVELYKGFALTAASGAFSLTGAAAGLLLGRLVTAEAGSFVLSGTAASLLKGFALSAQGGSFTLTGANATLTYTPLGAFVITADSGSFALTGSDASFLRGIVLGAGSGAFALSGTDALLARGFTLGANSGSYALDGAAAGVYKGTVLEAASGSFALTGIAAVLLHGRLLAAAAGSFALTGTPAGFLKGTVLDALGGNFALSGAVVALARGFLLAASSGSYALAGTAASLVQGFRLSAENGAYALTGADAGLYGGRNLLAGTSSFALTGADAALIWARGLLASAGAFTLTGKPVTFTWARVWSVTPDGAPAPWENVPATPEAWTVANDTAPATWEATGSTPSGWTVTPDTLPAAWGT